MDDYIDRLEQLRKDMEQTIELIALKHNFYLRVIVPSQKTHLGFDYHEDTSSLSEISSVPWYEHRGWSKPDVALHGIEIRHLWRDIKPFEWKTK